MTAATILGQRLANRYRILREVAEGSTGTVYLADDAATKTKVVVKVLIPDLSFDSRTLPHLRQRLQRRLKIDPEQGTALSHIVDITDVGILSNDDLFVVMPYLQGDNLAALLRKRRILSWAQARTLVVTVGRLIAEYHREMLLEGTWPVLGTLQSSNCFCLRGQPRAESVKLVNSAVDELIIRRQWRENGSHVASLARYGAPELSTGERLDVRADVYSLGVIVYELLTAKVPFEDSNAPRLEAMHLMSPVPLPQVVAPAAKIADELQVVLLKALEKRPEDRYPTMTAFVDALQAVKAKKLPAVRRGSGGTGRPARSRGDTMIMASPYFEDDENDENEENEASDGNEANERPLSADPENPENPDEGAAKGALEGDEGDEGDEGEEGDEGDEGDEDEGVDELAAAMEASDTEVSGVLEAPEESEPEPRQPPPLRRPKVITRKLSPVGAVEGTPEVVDEGHVEETGPTSSGRRPDTAPHSTRENTQVRRRPQALPDEPDEPRPPVLIRRSAASAGTSGVRQRPRLGGAAAGRASADADAGQTRGDENAATVRLPTVGASLESSGAKPPEAPQADAAKSGFGEEDIASGGSYWVWVVLALAVVGGVLYATGGLGFIPGAGGAGAEPQRTPLSSTSAESMELVRRARAAEKSGDIAEAYKLANASYESERTVEALEIMGRAACQLDDAEMAQWIYDHLPLTSRPQVQRVCHRTGLKLEP